jgi:hypothetical protein
MMTATAEEELTAYHEAGHVVAHLVTGVRFRYVTIRPRMKDHAGHVTGCQKRIEAWKGSFTAAAGPIAERYFITGDTVDSRASYQDADLMALCNGQWSDDIAQFDNACNADQICLRDERAQVWERIRSRVTGDLWPSVVAVAQALQNNKTLDYVASFIAAEKTLTSVRA